MKKKIIFSLLVITLFFGFYMWVDASTDWSSQTQRSGESLTILMIILYAIYAIRRKKLIRKAKVDLKNALKEDSSWNIAQLDEVVTQVFFEYKKARSSKNLSVMKQHMTKQFFEKVYRNFKIKILSNRHKNIIENVQLISLNLMSVRNYPGRDGDMFAMEVTASMIDYTIRESDRKFISSPLPRKKGESQSDYEQRAMTQAGEVKEYYIFIRYNGRWLLNNIKEKFAIIEDIAGLSQKKIIDVIIQEATWEYTSDELLYTD